MTAAQTEAIPLAFNLGNTIRQVLADHPDEPDPGNLAGLVVAAIPKRHRDTALEQMMRGAVRQEQGRARARAFNAAQLLAENAGGGGRENRSRSAAPTPSLVVDTYADAWARRMAASIHVGESVYKALGTCTEADLRFAAQERRDQAAATLERAAHYERMADAVKKHRVGTLADLPEKARRDLLA